MANPQPTDAHLRIAHSITEQLMVSHFSEQQRRILDLILRLSWGCGNKVAYIPHQRNFKIVGVREGHVKAHLDWLVEAKVIIRQGCYYQFNKDFDQWRVSRAAGYTKGKLTELVSLNLKYDKPKLTESVSQNLRNTEETTYGKRKLPTSKLASPKERLNKDKESSSSSSRDKENTIKELTLNEEIAELATQYEAEVGKITSFVAQELNDAVQNYPPAWIKEAIREAVNQNKRKWSYVKGILKNWRDSGRPGGKTAKKDDPDKFIKGKYGHMVRR